MNGNEPWFERCQFDNEVDAEKLYALFVEHIDRSELAARAEQVLKDKASLGGAMSVFADYSGGLIGFTLRKLLIDSANACCQSDLDKLADRLAKFYGFPPDWVPLRPLIREALAHTVHRRRIIERLQRELGKSVDLASVFDRVAATVRRAEDAFLLDNERIDAIFDQLRSISLDEGA